MIKKIKIIISVIIAIIIISSLLLYAFYIPNKEVLLNRNMDYNGEFNLISDNKKDTFVIKDMFIVNVSLINVPDGLLYIYPYMVFHGNEPLKNESLYNVLSNISMATGTYIELRPDTGCIKIANLENIVSESATILINKTQNWPFCLGTIKVNNRNSTMEIIIDISTCIDKNIKNIGNYSYNINVTLKKLEIIDKTHGYYHYMDYINGKVYYIKPEIKIINITEKQN